MERMRFSTNSRWLQRGLVAALSSALLITPLAGAAIAVPTPESLAPTNLVADVTTVVPDGTTTADVVVTWTAPVDIADVDSYALRYQEVGGSWTNAPAPSVSDVTATLSGLTVGSTYDIELTATDSGIPSDPAITSIDIAKPTKPILSVTKSDASALLEWTMTPTSTPTIPRPSVTSHVIEYRLATSQTWQTWNVPNGDETLRNAKITGLTNDLEYDFRVAAVNAIGTSAESNVVAATPSPLPSKNPTDGQQTPPTTPTGVPAELGSWCLALFPRTRPAIERRDAQQLMAGYIDFGKGGKYYIGGRPNWKPQPTADTSGNRHVNSLDWALPLLYRGVRTQKVKFIDRFRELMHYWIDDHKTSSQRTYWIRNSIYGGLRTQTLVCAAQTLGDKKIARAANRDAKQMLSSFGGARQVAYGSNNTDLIRQTGAFANACWRSDIGNRDRSWGNLVSVARNVIHDDGSDVEGSPGYAVYMELLFQDIENSAATCGISAAPIPQIRQKLYTFISYAVRPDFLTASLGDSINASLRGSFGVGNPNAEWLRSGGAAGEAPSPTYATFDGGYVFGRSAWLARNVPGSDTYYSLRYSSSRSATTHTHDDGAAMTLFSQGVEWIGDPGPYRYQDGSSLRAFMKSRSGHSSFTVSNVSRTRSLGVQRVQSQTDGNTDVTCLRDRTWSTVEVTRCVTFVRSLDALVVVDYANGSKQSASGKKKRKAVPSRVVTQRWQLPPGVSPSRSADGFTLVKGGATMNMVTSPVRGWKSAGAREGSSVGWFTGEWGKKEPGAVLYRNMKMPKKGGSKTLVTVFVPGNGQASIGANSVTVTRGGVSTEVPLPKP